MFMEEHSSATKSYLYYLTRKHTLCVLLLGFFSGLPFLLIGSTLQAWFTKAGLSTKTIGLMALVYMPYTWKFFWAPLIDRYRLPLFGRRRCWIALMQIAMAIVLVVLALQNPAHKPLEVAFLAALLAAFSATQNIAVDAYQTEILKPEERGIGASYYVFGYRAAMLFSGGGALFIAAVFGWHNLYLLMALVTLLGVFVAWFAPEPDNNAAAPRDLRSSVVEPFKDYISRPAAIIILCFIVLYKLGDNFTLSLSTTFLMRYCGFHLITIGGVYKGLGFAAMMIGAFIGGIGVLRLGLFRALLIFGIFQMLATLGFLMMVYLGKNYSGLVFTVCTENLSAGMGTSAFFAFLMSLCNRRFTATQYALFSALFSIGPMITGPIAGEIVSNWGWATLFTWAFFTALPALLILLYLRKRISFQPPVRF